MTVQEMIFCMSDLWTTRQLGGAFHSQWRSQGHCFWGGASSERRRHSRGFTPNFYTDLDFWNGLEHNYGGGAVAPLAPPPPLNYATVHNWGYFKPRGDWQENKEGDTFFRFTLAISQRGSAILQAGGGAGLSPSGQTSA